MGEKELLQLKHNSKASITQSVGRSLHCLSSKYFPTDAVPILLSILGNILTTSKLTRIALELKSELFISSIISNIWKVSLIRDGNLLANSVLQPHVITLTRLFSLCRLTLPYIFPAVELEGVIKDFYLFSKIFLLYHFSIRLRYNYLTASHAKTIKQHTLQYVTKSEIYGKDVDIPGNYQWTLLNLLLNTDVFFELYETFLIFGY